MIATLGNRSGVFASLMVIMSLIMAMFVSCSKTVADERLKGIAVIVSDSTKAALSRLENIDPESLSTADRHYRNLLIIKARDKAYIQHKSDSLIMTVVDYAETHNDLDWYPEALYYAGRVYSDLGDSPTALRYFHSALDALPEKGCDLNLKSAVLSQTAGLLRLMRLFDEAAPLLDQSISIGKEIKDTLNTVYDLLLLGDTELNNNNLSKARGCFMEALEMSRNLRSKTRAISELYLAVIYSRLSYMDKAVQYLEESRDSVSKNDRVTYLAHASQIYKKAHMNDSAYACARRILSSDYEGKNRLVAYQVLLSPEIRKFSSEDSIQSYISAYAEEFEKHLNDSQRELVLYQQSHYNYEIHEREKVRAIAARKNMQIWILLLVAVVCALISVVYYLKYSNKLKIMKLQQYLAKIAILETELNKQDKIATIIQNDESVSSEAEEKIQMEIPTSLILSTDQESLKQQLRDKLKGLASNVKARSANVDASILKSKMYKSLQDMIRKHEGIKENSEFWNEMEKAILKTSPDFKHRLDLLSGGKISAEEYHTAMLVKCGVKPTEIAVLVHRAKGTITYRRKNIGLICFGEEFDPNVIDKIIHCL